MSDLESIAGFQQHMAMETENRRLEESTILQGVESVLREPEKGFYIIARCGERIIASLMVTREWSDWRNGWFWWIQSVYVVFDFRRKGIFSRMYHHVRQRASTLDNVCGLRLYVERKNHNAIRTYRSLGMVETSYRLFEEEFQR